MKKISAFLLVATALLATSCKPNGNSSASISFTKESNSVSESTTSFSSLDISTTTSNTSSNSSESISSESSTTSSSVEPKTWSNLDAKVFSSNVDGYVIPYYEMEGNKVFYIKDDNAIYVAGAKCTPEDLKNWADLFVKDGFTLEKSEKNYYIFYKELTVNGNYRKMYVDMGSVQENEQLDETGYGTFQMIISDPFVYSWPETAFKNLTTKYIESTAVIPEFEAKYFSLYDYGFRANFVEVYCYGYETTNAVMTYKRSLQSAGFTVLTNKSKDSNCYEAISQDLKLKVLFNEDTTYRSFYISVIEYIAWPEVVQAAVNALTYDSGTILPAYSGALSYEFVYEYYAYTGYMYVYIDTYNKDSAEDYAALLRKEGYTVKAHPEFEHTYICNSAKGDLFVKVQYTELGGLMIMFNDYTAGWPGNDILDYINLVINPSATTALPVLEGDAYRLVGFTAYKMVLLKTVGITQAKFDAYIKTLRDLNYQIVENDSNRYEVITPSKDFSFLISLNEDMVQFEIGEYKEGSAVWPTADIDAMIAKIGATGTIPVYKGPGAVGYQVNEDLYGTLLVIDLSSEYKTYSQCQALADPYIEMLVELGYKDMGIPKGKSDHYYVLPGTTLGLACYCGYPGQLTIEFLNIEDYEF